MTLEEWVKEADLRLGGQQGRELLEAFQKLSRACQIFTSAMGSEQGYIPSLGAPLTAEALQLMGDAGVKPVFFWERRKLQQEGSA